MDKRQSKIIILVCLAASAVLVFFVFGSKKQPAAVAPLGMPTETSGPVPLANAEAPRVVSVGAPDGKFTLSMTELKGKDNVTYTFRMKDESSGTETQIYTDTVPVGTTLSVPANTFSSDDKYIFLKQTGSGGTRYFVLTSSGEAIAKDVQTIDFSSLFASKYPNYTITDATGWAGPTLVVINVNNSDGSLGPSFWFDVSTQSFILLSTRFN